MVEQFDICLITLDPTIGKEIKKTRPCLVISPNEMNRHLKTIIIAPMTSTMRNYPSRVSLNFQGKKGQVALDQIRSIDKVRVIKKLGTATPATAQKISKLLITMFSL